MSCPGERNDLGSINIAASLTSHEITAPTIFVLHSAMVYSSLLHRFGDPVERVVGDALRGDVSRLLGRPGLGFPGSQPVTLCRKHLSVLESTEYMVYEKTDGVRSLLYVTADVELSKPVCYLIGRKNDYYQLKRGEDISAALNVFALQDFWQKGTLLDGEAAVLRETEGQRPQYVFVAFDCLAVAGRATLGLPHAARRVAMKPLFASLLPLADHRSGLQVCLKRALPAYRTRTVLHAIIPTLRHGNDGLVFVSRHASYSSGTDHSMFKWKPPGETTIDFKLGRQFRLPGKDHNKFSLLVHLGAGRYQHFAELKLSPSESNAILALGTLAYNSVLECFLDAAGCWRPKMNQDGNLCFRHDKKHGNHISVVGELLESMADSITEEELIRLSDKTWENLKLRVAESVMGPCAAAGIVV